MKSLSNTKFSLLITTVLCLVMLLAIPVGGTAATVTVTSLADGGPGSLRQVITAASSGDTVIFDPILTGKTIILTNGEISVAKNLTINGLGAASLSVSATNLSRVFSISGASTVTISALTITGGSTLATGGAIYNNAGCTLNVANCVLSGSAAAVAGGALANDGTLTLTGCSVLNNAVPDTKGAGVYNNTGVATIIGGVFSNNIAGTGSGGGLYNEAGGTLTLTNLVLLTSNAATNGAGLFNTGTLTVLGSTFRQNIAGAGGGLRNESAATVSNCLFTGNNALLGGGLYNAATGNLLLTASVVSSNTCLGDGAGVLNFGTNTTSGTTFTGNATGMDGGGFHSLVGVSTITNCVFTGNTAQWGGGLNCAGETIITRCLIANNSASTNGGGIFTFGGGHMEITESVISSNSTFGSGGGVYITGTNTIQQTTFLANTAGTDGGALHNTAGALTHILISTFAGNSATGNGGAIASSGELILTEATIAGNGAANGGALAILAGTLTMDNTILASSASGGNFTNDVSATLESKGHNLSDDATALSWLNQPGDLNSTASGLDPAGPLNNGGTTPTIALLPGSAAISAGGILFPPFTDQRGYPRFVCGKMDIGAYQTQENPLPVITLIGSALVTNQCSSLPYVDPGAVATNICGDGLTVSAGRYHSLALRNDGIVEAWGGNDKGQTNVTGGLDNVIQISAGEEFSLALQFGGTVTGWGDNAFGQTGVTSSTNVLSISAGGFHALARLDDGTVTGWGNNDFGQTTISLGATNVTAISAGRYHSLALIADGSVVAWGGGTTVASPEDGINYGQSIVPAFSTNVTAVAAGGYHSLALLADGTVVGWGAGTTNASVFVDFGQSTVPASATNVTAIAAGGYHSLALRADGTVVAWGNNAHGQSDVPTDLPPVAAISAGFYHSLVVTRDGTVIGWGLNSNLQTVATSDLRADLTSAITTTISGVTNDVGSFTITYKVVDSHGATNSVVRTVVITDTNAPTFSVCPSSIVQGNDTGFCGARVWYATPVASDNCIVTVSQVSGLPSGSLFPVGVTTNTYMAVDHGVNTTLCTFTVTVNDTEKPKVTVPADIEVATLTNSCASGPVTYTPTATDNCGVASIVALPSSGSSFPIGMTTVTCIATDTAGNTATNTFKVTVKDQTVPTLTCPSDIVTNGFASGGAVVTFADPTVVDNCPISTTVICSPASGSVFPYGQTTVHCYAADTAGNVGECSFTITVKGPLDNLQKVFEGLIGLGLTNAATALNQGLNPDLWSDNGHVNRLNPKYAKAVFKACRRTLSVLHKKPAVDNPGVPAVIDELLFAMHQLAVIQLDDAVTYGGDAKHIAKGNNLLTQGETASRPESAAKSYEKAWREAVKSLRKLFI